MNKHSNAEKQSYGWREIPTDLRKDIMYDFHKDGVPLHLVHQEMRNVQFLPTPEPIQGTMFHREVIIIGEIPNLGSGEYLLFVCDPHKEQGDRYGFICLSSIIDDDIVFD